MTLLITGGTGFIGQKLTEAFLDSMDKIIIYSRSESKQAEMRNKFQSKKLRFYIGDVRDKLRLIQAMSNVDVVIHAAALKRIETCEYNPDEAVKTNVDGTQNVISACIANTIQAAIFISTDKAVEPINIYGATKAVAEKLWIASCVKKPIFSAVRYGNVLGSTGSVIPYFKVLKLQGVEKMPVTVPNMSRFLMFPQAAIQLIKTALNEMPQVIYVAKAKAYSNIRLCAALGVEWEEIGARPGEKYHETLISKHESFRVFDYGDHFRIAPEMPYDDELTFCEGEKIPRYTDYNSYDADWYTVHELGEII